jgi:ribonuclease P protein component
MPDDFSFGKTHRIASAADFARIKKRGNRKTSKCFIMLQLPNSLGEKRIGVIVTRKIGKANIRNRWKRYLKEFFRLNKRKFPSSTDSVFIVKNGAVVPKHFNELEIELNELLGSNKN